MLSESTLCWDRPDLIRRVIRALDFALLKMQAMTRGDAGDFGSVASIPPGRWHADQKAVAETAMLLWFVAPVRERRQGDCRTFPCGGDAARGVGAQRRGPVRHLRRPWSGGRLRGRAHRAPANGLPRPGLRRSTARQLERRVQTRTDAVSQNGAGMARAHAGSRRASRCPARGRIDARSATGYPDRLDVRPVRVHATR